MNITLTPVKSSQIAAIGHDPATNTLAIQFKKKSGPGSVYHYSNVTPEMFEAFQRAESKGRFFGAHIKDAKGEGGALLYPYTKIEPQQPAESEAA